jgi:hypothetical protein
MARVLHLLEGGAGDLARTVVDQQRGAGDEVSVAVLPGGPDLEWPAGVAVGRVPADLSWETLLERIFEADQVIAW